MISSQIVINILLDACVIVLIGAGLFMTYRTIRFFNFAHAAVFSIGAYCVFFFKEWCGLSLYYSITLAVLLSVFLGCMMNSLIYHPLRHKGCSTLILILSSLGIYIALQNVISIVFGDDIKSIRSATIEEGINILGARITLNQILIIGTSVIIIISLMALLRCTKLGKALRAVASDPELANVSGINVDRIIQWSFAIGSALACAAGILVALDVDMIPTMGMNALMMGIVAVIIGGARNIYGVALGALLLAVAQHLSVWFIGSEWQDAMAFVVLFAFLIHRPQGFYSKVTYREMI